MPNLLHILKEKRKGEGVGTREGRFKTVPKCICEELQNHSKEMDRLNTARNWREKDIVRKDRLFV